MTHHLVASNHLQIISDRSELYYNADQLSYVLLVGYYFKVDYLYNSLLGLPQACMNAVHYSYGWTCLNKCIHVQRFDCEILS